MSHPAKHVLCFRLILAGYFFRRTIPPLIRMRRFFRVKILYRILQGIEADSLFRKNQQTSAHSVRKGYPPRICAMSVLLRTDIINIHLFDTRLIPSHHRAGIAIDIIFYRTASEILHSIHYMRNTETHSDTRHFKNIFLFHFLTRSESRQIGIFQYLRFFCFTIGLRKLNIYIDNSVSIYPVSYQILITGRQIIRNRHQHCFPFFSDSRITHLEVTTRLFPYLQTLGITVAIIVIIGRAPEIRLHTESFIKKLGSVHLIGCYHTGGLVQFKINVR